MNKLKLVREEKGLTQAQTGAFINRSAMFISRVENGKAQLSDAQIASLASALGVREAWLRTGTGPMTDHELTRDRRSIGERILEVRKSWHESSEIQSGCDPILSHIEQNIYPCGYDQDQSHPSSRVWPHDITPVTKSQHRIQHSHC